MYKKNAQLNQMYALIWIKSVFIIITWSDLRMNFNMGYMCWRKWHIWNWLANRYTVSDASILFYLFYRKCCKKQEDKSEITWQCFGTKYYKRKSHRLHIFHSEQRRGDETTSRFTRDLRYSWHHHFHRKF